MIADELRRSVMELNSAMDASDDQQKPLGDSPAIGSYPAVIQNVIALGGFAYGVINGDLHVHGDGRPVYTLELGRPREAPPVDRLLSLPSQLLDARHEIMPFAGRVAELESLINWRDSGPRLSVLFLHGPGGQGKTRIAAKFAELSKEAEWRVVHARHGGDRTSMPDGSQFVGPGESPGLLLLVDYADRWPHSHLEWLFRNRLLHTPVPTRVLLIGRSVHGWPALQHALTEVYADTQDLVLPPLDRTVAERQITFEAARDRYSDLYGVDRRDEIGPPSGLEDSSYELVLSLHMAALVAVDAYRHGVVPPSKPAHLSAYLLNREHAHWFRLHGRVEHGGTFRTEPTLIARTAFVASLVGQQPKASAVALLTGLQSEEERDTSVEQVLADHAVCYPAGDGMALEPLYPDRLAEDFLALQLPGHGVTGYVSDPQAQAVTRLLLERNPAGEYPAYAARAIIFLAAAADRWAHVGGMHLYPLIQADPELAAAAGSNALVALSSLRDISESTLAVVNSTLPAGRDLDLDVGHAAVTVRLTNYQLQYTLGSPERAQLLAVLSYQLAKAGRAEEAVPPCQEAVRLRRLLARWEPASFEPVLGESLTSLALRLAAVGQRQAALSAARESVELHGRLAGADPANHELGYAIALCVLGMAWWEAGNDDEALRVTLQHVELCRRLAAANPAMYEFDLATGLTNLSQTLSAMRRFDEAHTAAAEAVELFRGLAREQPKVYEPDFAASLVNLHLALVSLDRHEEALVVARDAVKVYRRLSAINAAMFESPLVIALDSLSSELARLGHDEEAISAAAEAIAICRRLVGRNPIRHEPDLARALGSYADQMDDGHAAAEEALTILRRLAAVEPARFGSELARALENRARILRKKGDLLLAHRVLVEAVAIYEAAHSTSVERSTADLTELEDLMQASGIDLQRA
ncbi:tetratricopeptide repeat protein [Dactylosporangium sp. CA-233914]|uniref:tetratricopeptide repeat protein n=1 Tax=Dactylosporangium sp. CA-233914 TaxID=3239934 RepID=UPI003D91161A